MADRCPIAVPATHARLDVPDSRAVFGRSPSNDPRRVPIGGPFDRSCEGFGSRYLRPAVADYEPRPGRDGREGRSEPRPGAARAVAPAFRVDFDSARAREAMTTVGAVASLPRRQRLVDPTHPAVRCDQCYREDTVTPIQGTPYVMDNRLVLSLDQYYPSYRQFGLDWKPPRWTYQACAGGDTAECREAVRALRQGGYDEATYYDGVYRTYYKESNSPLKDAAAAAWMNRYLNRARWKHAGPFNPGNCAPGAQCGPGYMPLRSPLYHRRNLPYVRRVMEKAGEKMVALANADPETWKDVASFVVQCIATSGASCAASALVGVSTYLMAEAGLDLDDYAPYLKVAASWYAGGGADDLDELGTIIKESGDDVAAWALERGVEEMDRRARQEFESQRAILEQRILQELETQYPGLGRQITQTPQWQGRHQEGLQVLSSPEVKEFRAVERKVSGEQSQRIAEEARLVALNTLADIREVYIRSAQRTRSGVGRQRYGRGMTQARALGEFHPPNPKNVAEDAFRRAYKQVIGFEPPPVQSGRLNVSFAAALDRTVNLVEPVIEAQYAQDNFPAPKPYESGPPTIEFLEETPQQVRRADPGQTIRPPVDGRPPLDSGLAVSAGLALVAAMILGAG